MEKLRNSILIVRGKNENTQGQHFASDQDLQQLITRQAVLDALFDKDISKDCRLEAYHIDHAVDVVVRGAHKIFAILVIIRQTKYIRNFVESDHFKEALDHGLPFQEGALKSFFPTQVTAREFFEQQWHFTAPVFSDSVFHRVFSNKTIMPYLEEELLGSGGFGSVYRIKVSPSHHLFQASREVSRMSDRMLSLKY